MEAAIFFLIDEIIPIPVFLSFSSHFTARFLAAAAANFAIPPPKGLLPFKSLFDFCSFGDTFIPSSFNFPSPSSFIWCFTATITLPILVFISSSFSDCFFAAAAARDANPTSPDFESSPVFFPSIVSSIISFLFFSPAATSAIDAVPSLDLSALVFFRCASDAASAAMPPRIFFFSFFALDFAFLAASFASFA